MTFGPVVIILAINWTCFLEGRGNKGPASGRARSRVLRFAARAWGRGRGLDFMTSPWTEARFAA